MSGTVDAANTSAKQSALILDLPSELLLYILSSVSARDLLAFRQSCKHGATISRDHALWLELLRWQREHLPMPAVVRNGDSLVSLDSTVIEDLVVSVQRSSDGWLQNRSRSLHLGGTPDEHNDILCLEVLLDQFILCVHSNGSINIWDTDKTTEDESPAFSWDLWADEPFTSAHACADEATRYAYVAVTRTQHPTESGSTTFLVTLPLPAASILGAELEEGDTPFRGAEGQVVRAIDTQRHLIAFSRISFIDIIHWPSKTGMSINTHTDDLEELWNGIIGLKFVDDRLLCIRARSIELYPVDFPFPEHAKYFVLSSLDPEERVQTPTAALIRPLAVHNFFRTNFRTLSLSGVNVTELGGPTRSRRTTIFLLGNDVLRGVFHYRVDISDVEQLDKPKVPPELNVSLLSIYMHLDGFVVAVALGPQGRRGALIERTRSSTARRVLAFTCPLTTVAQSNALSTDSSVADKPPAESEKSEENHKSDEEDPVTVSMRDMRPLDAVDVYNVHSLDLRQDILHVAFSEVTGRIALGTRAGDVRLI